MIVSDPTGTLGGVPLGAATGGIPAVDAGTGAVTVVIVPVMGAVTVATVLVRGAVTVATGLVTDALASRTGLVIALTVLLMGAVSTTGLVSVLRAFVTDGAFVA